MATTGPWRNPGPALNLDEVRNRVPPHSMIPSRLCAWWPALVWSALLFLASTDSLSREHTSRYFVPLMHGLFPFMTSDTIDFVHHIFRKFAHLTEYFIFFLLVYRGVRMGRSGFHWSWALVAWLIAAAYSLSDEFHQTFVASRGPSIWDCLLDSKGALLALFSVFLVYRFYRRSRSS